MREQEQKQMPSPSAPIPVPQASPSAVTMHETLSVGVGSPKANQIVEELLSTVEFTGSAGEQLTGQIAGQIAERIAERLIAQLQLSENSHPSIEPDSEKPDLTAVPIFPEPNELDMIFERTPSGSAIKTTCLVDVREYLKTQVLPIAKPILALLLATPVAYQSFLCGKIAAQDILIYFGIDDITALQIIYGDTTGPVSGAANLGLYATNIMAFSNLSRDDICLFRLEGKSKKYLAAVYTSIMLAYISAGTASISSAANNALGEVDFTLRHKVLSFAYTSGINSLLNLMYVNNLINRTLLPIRQAMYARAIHKLSNTLKLKSTAEQIQLIQTILQQQTSHLDSSQFTELLNILSTKKINGNVVSDAQLLHHIFDSLNNLTPELRLSICNTLMHILDIQIESALETYLLMTTYVISSLIATVGCLGNLYGQQTGEQEMFEKMGMSKNASTKAANASAPGPWLSKLAMYMISQFNLVDLARDTPTLLMQYSKLPYDIKISLIAPLIFVAACTVSGSCYGVDAYEAFHDWFPNLSDPLTLLMVLSNFYAAASVNTASVAKKVCNSIIEISNWSYIKFWGCFGYSLEQLDRHIPGTRDLSEFASRCEADTKKIKLSEAVSQQVTLFSQPSESSIFSSLLQQQDATASEYQSCIA